MGKMGWWRCGIGEVNSGGVMGEEVGKGEAGGFRYKVKQRALKAYYISGLVVRITDLHKMVK